VDLLGGHSYRERRPVPSLDSLVSSVWVQQVAPGARPWPHRNVPNGSVEIRCRLGRVPEVVGPLTRPFGERVACSAGPGAAVAVLQEALAGRLTAPDGPDTVIAEAVRLMRGRAGDVTPVRAALWVSERQFRRRCLAAVGVPPKALQRMLRFQAFLARVQFAVSRGGAPRRNGLARLAVECGYADQAHLSRECVRLTGVTPGVFLRETEQSCGCGHEHEASFAPFLHPAE
jgi:AraC-like DNA-binding protein